MVPKRTLAELAAYLNAKLVGDADCPITALANLQEAKPGQLSFLANPVYKKYLQGCAASAVIMHPDTAESFSGNKLLVDNPYVAYAEVSALFDDCPQAPAGQHPSAVIGEGCEIGRDVAIGPNAVVGAGTKLEDGVEVGPGTCIGADSHIGARTRLAANVTVYHGVSIGADCIIHSSAVIGGDGFGFAFDQGEWRKIHQLGGVILGDRVEIGACTTVDRGALDNTRLEDGVKVDSQVQIGHNVRIGKNTAIAANAAIAGSVSVGENCTVAGCVGIAGHVTITDQVHISGMSMVSNSISEPGSYSSGTPLTPSSEWRKNAVRFKQLNAFATRLKQLEKDKQTD